MRLSEWRQAAPNKDSLSNRVLAVLRHTLVDLGSEPDAECWVAWGDDPETRYSVMAATAAGLITAVVRPADPEGPRVTAKLVRWSKVSVSELGIEAAGGHRLVGVQVESQVLKGVDEEADRICEFVRGLIAGIENRGTAPAGVASAPITTPTVSLVALPALVDDEFEPEPEESKSPEAEVEAESGPEPDLGRTQDDEPVQVVADMESPESSSGHLPKAAAVASAKVVPISSKSAPRPAAATATSAAPTPPTPIAARAAANVKSGDPVPPTRKTSPVEPAANNSEPLADHPPRIGPHAIEDPAPPPKPRPWIP